MEKPLGMSKTDDNKANAYETGNLMTQYLPPYPAYKDIGIPWLGRIPAHWKVVPNRALMKLKKEIVGERSENLVLLSLTKQGIIARDMENPEGKFPANFDTYQIVEPGDLVFCLFDIDETPRTVGLATLYGMITGAYTRFVCPDPTLRKFVYLYYLSLDNGKLLKPLYTGLRKVISKSTFLSAKLPLPPLAEQRAIARYLDWADARIRRLIRARQRQIKLLEEYKQALIHQAVTGQVDVRTGKPYPTYKDSGIPWLGRIPEHWRVMLFKHLFMSAMGQTILASDLQENGKYPVFSATEKNIYFGRISSPRFVLNPGDLVIPARGVSIGAVKFVKEPCVCTQTTIYAIKKSDVNTKYVFYFLLGCRQWLFEYDRTAIPQLTVDQVRNNHLIFPPLPKQAAIVEYLDTQTARIDAAIASIRRSIDLLREYRTRLIADVVTGKVDVREVAAQLPEEPPEDDAGDEEMVDVEAESDLLPELDSMPADVDDD